METLNHPILISTIELYFDAYFLDRQDKIYLLVEAIKKNILDAEDKRTVIDNYEYFLNVITQNRKFISRFTDTSFEFANQLNQLMSKIRNEQSLVSIERLLFLSPEQTILALEHFTVDELYFLEKLPTNPSSVLFEYKVRFETTQPTSTLYFLYDLDAKKIDYCEYVGKIMPMNNEKYQGLYDYHLPIFKIFEQSTDYNIILTNNYDSIKNKTYVYVHTVDHISNFIEKYGVDIDKTIPKNVLKDINQGNAIYILNSSQEGVPISPYYFIIQRVLENHIHKPYRKNFIVLTGNKFEEKTIQLFNSGTFIPSAKVLRSIQNYYHSLVRKTGIHLYAFRYFEMCIATQYLRHYANYSYEEKCLQLEKRKFKTYLCFNGHEKEFRYALCFLLWENNLFEAGSLSLRKIDCVNDLSAPVNKSITNNILKKRPHKWHEFIEKLPLIADKENVYLNYWYQVDLNLVNQTFLWIITETTFSDNYFNLSFSFLTEKTYKPIALFMPFIMVGDKHSLKTLKAEGYQTFDKWWSESYDNISCATKRLRKVVALIKEICLKSNEEKYRMYLEMKSVLNHNHHLLISRCKDSYFNSLVE
jgi:hypothetical protein